MLRASLCGLQAALSGLRLLLLTERQWAASPLGSAALMVMARADHQHFLSRSCQLGEILVMLSMAWQESWQRMNGCTSWAVCSASTLLLLDSCFLHLSPVSSWSGFLSLSLKAWESWVYCSFSIPERQLSWPEHGSILLELNHIAWPFCECGKICFLSRPLIFNYFPGISL